MVQKLTQKSIDRLPPATGKRYEVRDGLVLSLILRISNKGRKVWYLAARIDCHSRRIKIGSYPILSLADAREQARSIQRDIQLGLFGQEEKAQTLGETIPKFIEIYAKPRNRDWRGSERVLTKFERLNNRPLDEIKRADIVRVLDDIAAGGAPFRANRALAAIRKLFNWCVDRGTLEVNPVAGLKPPTKEVSRDRVLSDDELLACWTSADAEGFPFGPFVQLLILTGQRRGEVSGMRWPEIDLDILTFPDCISINKAPCYFPAPFINFADEKTRTQNQIPP